jgi:hypothetical protein
MVLIWFQGQRRYTWLLLSAKPVQTVSKEDDKPTGSVSQHPDHEAVQETRAPEHGAPSSGRA